MKIWIAPELVEMKASLTQQVLARGGHDYLGEEAENPSTGEIVSLGSCC